MSFAFRSIILFFLFCKLAAASESVGFRTLKTEALTVGVWYPTDAPEQPGRMGPFDVNVALDASPKPGRYQPVLMSHGNGGRIRNHHLTATALARSGFVAIAPEHTADEFVRDPGSDNMAEAINWRVSELSHALEAVLQLSEFREIIDLSKVHGVGYSLGTLTMLAASGAGVDIPAASAHCARNEDPNFCDDPGFFTVWRMKRHRKVKTPDFPRKIPEVYFSYPLITGNIALIAPFGQGVIFDENIFSARSVFVVGLENDEITVPKYHANILAKLIPQDRLFEFTMHAGNHHAFISPFAKRVTDVEDIPAAKDPPGFDRLDFLKSLNDELVAFFNYEPVL